jgi:RHS repeat-associated protein
MHCKAVTQRRHPRAQRWSIALGAAVMTFASGLSLSAPPARPVASRQAAGAETTLNVATGAAVTLAAGRTPGAFGVTHSGAATYRIPLWTPPGVGGAELALALVYSSRAGNGTLGAGWSLQGLSAITRCNRTWAQDGVAGGVSNTSADRYCLDGQQLKLVAGTYGAPGSTYATEVESFARIVANGTIGNGPASFTVTSRSGQVQEYGSTADSRAYAGGTGTVRSWALSRIGDRAGNSVALAYFNDAGAGAYGNGSFRIAAIAYPTTATGQGPFYEVVFGYSARPAADVPTGYLAGYPVREPNKLDTITIRAVGTYAPIKSYNLAYGTSPTNGRLRLTSVQECGANSCFEPTAIGYQDGVAGWQATRVELGYSASPQQPPLAPDLNGDGYSDLLYPVASGSNKVAWRIALGGAAGYAPPFDTGLVSPNSARVVTGNFLGNGRTQFLVQVNGYWVFASYGPYGLAASSTGLVPSGEYAAADFDGDGLADLVAQSGSPSTFSVRRNVSTPGTGSVQFAPAAQAVWTVPTGRAATPVGDATRVIDLNGDGRADIAALSYRTADRVQRYYATPLLSNGFGQPFTLGQEREIDGGSMVASGDWNADGCSDLIQVRTVQLSNCAGGLLTLATSATNASGTPVRTAVAADWNGDGRTDLLYIDYASKQWHVVPSTGEGAAAAINTGIAAPDGTAWFVLDADADGQLDLGMRDDARNNRLRYHLRAAPAVWPDLATRFSDGFGMTQWPVYGTASRGAHQPDADAVFPEADYQGALPVVTEFASNDGSRTYRTSLQYFGARMHLQGRGFEGFRAQRIVDGRNGLVTVDVAQRAYPYTGQHVQRMVYQSSGSVPVSEWTATVATRWLGGGTEARALPYVSSTLEKRYGFGGALNGSLVSEASTSYALDTYGNTSQVVTAVTDRDPQSPFAGSTWQSTASYSYVNDTGSWCLGLPASSSITTTAPGQAPATRTASFASDSGACRVTQQVLEPNTPALKVASSYGFDGCGNLSVLSVVGALQKGSAMPARTTRFGYGTRCQLPETVTDALGNTTTYAYRYDFGTPTRSTDPNGAATSWAYDEFGRRVQEVRPDGTRSDWSFASCSTGPCWGVHDLRFLEYRTDVARDGSTIRQTQRYYDGYERLRYDEWHRALGVWTAQVAEYDSFGRLTALAKPYSSVYLGASYRDYDALGRLIAVRDHDANGAFVRSWTLGYAGRSVTTTDPLGRSRSNVYDLTGKLRRVTDPAPGSTTTYDYDSLGNLAFVRDANGSVSRGSYNARGFRTQWSDDAGGTWNYNGNSLNEVLAWTDAKGQSFFANYDALGRMVDRAEPEGLSSWTWGTSAADHNIGRLAGRSGLGYVEAFGYDGIGRLANRTITTDQAYQYDYTYNDLGALDTLTYPASPVPAGTSAPRLKLRYGYSYGELAQIEDVTSGAARSLWSLQADNDYGSPTQEALAGGLVRLFSQYDSLGNRIIGQQAGSGGYLGNLRYRGYQWDLADNLTQRSDLVQNVTEAFSYDALDRLTGSSLNGAPNLSVDYDAAGNVTRKSDVGSYGYSDVARRSAVTSAGAETFGYDANGNLASRNGVPQQWASFNLPTSLQKSGYEAQFWYGPDHQRWKQVARYQNGVETTHYVGGLLEKESTTSTGLTYWRHYVPTPGGSTVVISRNTDGSSSTTYALSDHLGSTDVLVSDVGGLKATLSYGAFGARRGSDGSTATAPDWLGIANHTRQGYTSHEMLDNVGLVHMNGRVYDPTLGRFLSPDPVMANPGDSQSINPYAYVGNRPLTTVDPSGMVGVEVAGNFVCGPVCGFAIGSALMTLQNFLGAGNPPPPPPAMALPGQSAQAGVGLCGAGTFSPTCGGNVLYAGAPTSPPSGGPGTSSWAHASPDDPYANENLARFFEDLGINAVDVLILAPYHDARDAYDAAERGDYAMAVVYVGFTACDVGKACQGLSAPFKAVRRLKPQRVFWSGGRVAEDAARAFAKANEGTVIGDIPAGRELSRVTRQVAWSEARPKWVELSEEFARGASGEVNVFQNANGLWIDSIWKNEHSVLMRNPNVSKILYNVVMPDGSLVKVP